MMEHQTAIDTLAPERYTLEEMDDAEREAFEEHYFGCIICAKAVKTLDRMFRVGKEVAQELAIEEDAEVLEERAKNSGVVPFPQPRRRTVPAWAAAASVMLLAGSTAYNELVRIPRIMQMQAPPAVEQLAFDRTSIVNPPLTSAMRDDGEPMKAPADRLLIQPVPIEHEDQFVGYACKVRRSDGKILQSVPIIPEQTSETVFVALRPLPAGVYDVVIEGVRKDGNRSEITRKSLVVGGS